MRVRYKLKKTKLESDHKITHFSIVNWFLQGISNKKIDVLKPDRCFCRNVNRFSFIFLILQMSHELSHKLQWVLKQIFLKQIFFYLLHSASSTESKNRLKSPPRIIILFSKLSNVSSIRWVGGKHFFFFFLLFIFFFTQCKFLCFMFISILKHLLLIQ